MAKCIVFHDKMLGNGENTTFEGNNLTVQIQENNNLTIQNWITSTEKGSAAFAVGTWKYFCFIE